MITIEGIVEEIIFSNEISGYTICDVDCDGDIHTAVGYMPFLNPGETVRLCGKWVTHAEYGDQLKVEYFEKVMPCTEDAIEKYLGSGIIKGIGPATATKIVMLFGKSALDIIASRPQELSEVKGISYEKAIRIGQEFAARESMRNTVMFFQGYGISPAVSMEIFRELGDEAVALVKENPYILSEKIASIGFRTSDRIAMTLGMDPASRFRVCSGIKHVLLRAASHGHTCLPEGELTEYTAELLQVQMSGIEDALASLLFDREIYIDKLSDKKMIYLRSYYNAEFKSAGKLVELTGYRSTCLIANVEQKLEKMQLEDNMVLASLQKQALMEAFREGALVITGGPGTGKTTIVRGIIRLLEGEGYRTELTAPTGRAAKRLSEATGREARTIHRLLEIGYSGDDREMTFQKNETNPIDTDFIIVDEVSMVDILLFESLLKAVAPGTRLVLVGDVNQLPSVGAGNVLKDIINSNMVKTVKLTEIFRQAAESMIVVNAHRINNGEMPFLNAKGKDFFFVSRRDQAGIVSTVTDLCARRLPETYGYDPLKHIQVLTPTRKGAVGVVNLNIELQKVLNPEHKKKNEKLHRDFNFRVGDRVMHIRNNYSLRWEKTTGVYTEGSGVFNGDTGVITRIDLPGQLLEVLFEDDRLVSYDFSILDELEPAYAVTIHKSQGNEFPVVVLPVFSGPPVLMTRNLLYTAVTRARDLVVVVGDQRILGDMVDNCRESLRYSGFLDKLASLSFK